MGLLLLLATAVVLCLAPLARADDNFPKLKALIEAGRFAEARTFAAHAYPDPETNKLTAAFAEALILKAQGRYADAAKIMRAILSAYPNLTRVRGELGDTLMRMGDSEGAAFNFQLLADSAGNSTQRGFYDNYLAAIRSERPWTLDTYLSIAPSTNINNGIGGKTVVIGGVPFDATSHLKKSGIGAAYGIAGTYRFDLAPMWDLTVGARGSGNLYADHSFDQTTGSVFSELAFSNQMWRVGLGVTGNRALSGWEPYNWDLGPQFSLRRNFGRLGTVIGTIGWKRIGYDQTSAYNGSETDLGLRYLKALSPSSSFGLGMLYSDVTAKVTFNAYNRYRPSLELYKELPFGLLASGTLSYEWRDYKTNFPLTGKTRADRQLAIDLGVTFRNLSWKGFAPKVQYTFTQNTSNVQLFDYTSHAISLNISKQY